MHKVNCADYSIYEAQVGLQLFTTAHAANCNLPLLKH